MFNNETQKLIDEIREEFKDTEDHIIKALETIEEIKSIIGELKKEASKIEGIAENIIQRKECQQQK